MFLFCHPITLSNVGKKRHGRDLVIKTLVQSVSFEEPLAVKIVK